MAATLFCRRIKSFNFENEKKLKQQNIIILQKPTNLFLPLIPSSDKASMAVKEKLIHKTSYKQLMTLF
jgi:hypothetical protein